MCHGSKFDWFDTLPTVLLGLRTCLRDGVDASPAEYLYGTTLRVPGQFFSVDDVIPDPKNFLESLRNHMSALKPIPVIRHEKVKPFCYRALKDCSHVFLRCETAHSLDRPYQGPLKVLARTSDKVYKVQRNNQEVPVTIERLKPALMQSTEPGLTTIPPEAAGESTKVTETQTTQPNPSWTSKSTSDHQTDQHNVPEKTQLKPNLKVKKVINTEHNYSTKPTESQATKTVDQENPPATATKVFVQPSYVPRILKTYHGRKCVRFKISEDLVTCK